MRRDAVIASRAYEVQKAARAWEKAGVVAGSVRSKIDELYADDRGRLPWGLSLLAGGATIFGGLALVGAVMALLQFDFDGATGAMILAMGLAFAVLTEIQTGPLRRANAGAELSTSLLACTLVVVGAAIMVDFGPGIVFPAAAVVFLLAAWWWGFATLAVIGFAFLLAASARWTGGRAMWTAVSIFALAYAVRHMNLERVVPAHRRCLRAMSVVAWLGLYAAIQYDSVALDLIGLIGGRPRHDVLFSPGTEIALTALVPIVIVLFGLRRREKLTIAVGVLLAVESLATWRYHWPWGPLWLTLALGGVACFVTAIAVRRFLDRSPVREWRGITAEPLLEDASGAAALRIAAVVGTFGHQPHAPSGDRPFQAGGGESGGGGADGRL